MDAKVVAERLILLLKEKQFHVTTAESCTGGLLASELVSVSGASDVFEEGYVTYSDRIKQKILHVRKETLENNTAVSRQTAEEMAWGAHMASGSELTISVTGYAGPGDGEDGTPAGTVYIGVFFDGKKDVRKYVFNGGRNEVRLRAAQAAMEFAVSCLESLES